METRTGCWTPLCRRAGGRRFTLHALRQAAASTFDNGGQVPIGSIQRLLGHAAAGPPSIICTAWGTGKERVYVLNFVGSNLTTTI